MIRNALSSLLDLPGPAERITPFEGMRGYAVLLVFLVHHDTLFGPFLHQPSVFASLSKFGHDIGHSGVDLFFLLSGFLIYGHVFQKAPSYGAYLRKRLRRIYPVFFFIVCAYVAISLWIPSVSKLPHGMAAAVYLVENLLFLPGIFSIDPLITVTWSLSYEFLFYLSIPLLIGALGMRSWRRAARISFFLALFVALCAASYFDVMPHIRLGMFIAGILLYETTEIESIKTRRWFRGEFLAIGVYFAALALLVLFEFSDARIVFHPHFPNRTFFYWTVFLSVGLFGLTFYTVKVNGILQWFFNLTPLRWLGNMSYSYFLSHGLVLQGVSFLLERVLAPQSQPPVIFMMLLILNLALTLAGSLVIFLLVEKPFSLTVKQPSVLPAMPSALSLVTLAVGVDGQGENLDVRPESSTSPLR